jgi:hypothetical protein
VLLGVSALLRDSVAAEVGGGIEVLLNPDLAGEGGARLPVVRAATGMAAVEEARAALAEDINLNTRLVLERAFLRLGDVAA